MDGGEVIACGFVRSGEAAPVLESIESPFDDVKPLVGLTVEGWRAAAGGAYSLPVRCFVTPSGIVVVMPRSANRVRLALDA